MPLIRKCKPKATNVQQLKNIIDTEFGFTVPGSDEFVKTLVRQTLSLMTSQLSKSCPASFYAVAKSENNIKTTEGILAVLGYVFVLPSVNKCIQVSKLQFAIDEKGLATGFAKPREDKEELPHNQEFTMAVKLLLPLLDKSDEYKLADQVKNPLRSLTQSSLAFYKMHAKEIDEVNKAYAFATASKSKKSKTKPIHVQNAVGKAARVVTTKLPFQDGNGNIYASYMDIRYSYRKLLEKLLQRRRSPKKRKVDDSDIEHPTDQSLSPKGRKRRGRVAFALPSTSEITEGDDTTAMST